MRSFGLASFLACLLLAGPSHAQLIPEGQDWRIIPFTLRDGKPMIAAQVNGSDGVMMLDNGTPEPVFLNRDALALPPGTEVGRGHAASGQPVVVQSHDAAQITLAGQPLPTLPVISGDLGFTAPGLGADFLGFVGTPLLAPYAFTIDYRRQLVTLFRVNDSGALAMPAPPPVDVLATVRYAIWPGEQPTTAVLIGNLPFLMDIDTGDSGTLYLSPETQTRLIAEGFLRPTDTGYSLTALTIADARFGPVPVQLISAGGPQDFRASGPADMLRLGSGFLAEHPVLWNFPAGTLTLLRPQSRFLDPR